MKLDFRKGFLYALLISLVASAVVTGVHQAVMAIDVSTLDPWSAYWIKMLQEFFGAAKVAFVVAFLYNILGYGIAYFRSFAEAKQLEYETYKYWETVAYYLNGIAIAFLCLPDPYKNIGVAIVFFIRLMYSVLKRIFGG